MSYLTAEKRQEILDWINSHNAFLGPLPVVVDKNKKVEKGDKENAASKYSKPSSLDQLIPDDSLSCRKAKEKKTSQ